MNLTVSKFDFSDDRKHNYTEFVRKLGIAFDKVKILPEIFYGLKF
jgi:hypothetical protein